MARPSKSGRAAAKPARAVKGARKPKLAPKAKAKKAAGNPKARQAKLKPKATPKPKAKAAAKSRSASKAKPKAAGPRAKKPQPSKSQRPASLATAPKTEPPKVQIGRDWSSTLFLPKTDFPMKAGLPEREPELLKRWREMGLYDRLREEGKGRPKFILHDGPPYANGNIHIGTGLNKILKDVINRSQTMMGKDANYVPGWDCHGLPIEWKVE